MNQLYFLSTISVPEFKVHQPCLMNLYNLTEHYLSFMMAVQIKYIYQQQECGSVVSLGCSLYLMFVNKHMCACMCTQMCVALCTQADCKIYSLHASTLCDEHIRKCDTKRGGTTESIWHLYSALLPSITTITNHNAFHDNNKKIKRKDFNL